VDLLGGEALLCHEENYDAARAAGKRASRLTDGEATAGTLLHCRRSRCIGRPEGGPQAVSIAAKGLVVKRIMVSAFSAAALSAALIAGAPANAASLTESAAQGLAVLGVPTPPPDSLTDAQVLQIMNVLSSSDGSDRKREHIQTIIGENEASGVGVGKYGIGQLRSSVGADLAALGVDASGIDSLTLSELAQIENITASQATNEAKKAQIAEVMGNEATATGRLGVKQLSDSTKADLAKIGVDAEAVDMLTLSQIAQIENVMSSSESDAAKRDQVNSIISD
jgi:hypothetical protein